MGGLADVTRALTRSTMTRTVSSISESQRSPGCGKIEQAPCDNSGITLGREVIRESGTILLESRKKFLVLVAFLAHQADFFVSNLLITTPRFPKKQGLVFWHVACARHGSQGNRDSQFQQRSLWALPETRHDLWLKRINTWIGILGGSVASVVGAYNFFPSAPGDIAAVVREQRWGTCSARARGAFDLTKCFARHFSDRSPRSLREKRLGARQLRPEGQQGSLRAGGCDGERHLKKDHGCGIGFNIPQPRPSLDEGSSCEHFPGPSRCDSLRTRRDGCILD